MATITCPHCNKQFDFDDSEVSEILEHARGEARETALAEARAAAERELERARADAARDLKAARETAERELKAAKEAAAAERESAVRNAASEERLAQAKAQQESDALVAKLRAQLEQERASAKANEELIRTKADQELATTTAELKAEVQRLSAEAKSQSEAARAQRELAVREATGTIERRVAELEQQLKAKDVEREAAVQSARAELVAQVNSVREDLTRQREESERRIREKDDEIGYLREMKMRLNTKMLGESLEQHCETEFNKIRATAFPKAYFEKDNSAVSDGDGRATKGDYIFRDFAEDGTEIVSIMFEMKTEQMDATHHKTNESHLKKLDADRKKKGCEYAVLVSTLEPDSELYNQGIVDVSYRYPKMYVIRPQFFIPLISFLSNSAHKSSEALMELSRVRQQNIDVTNFEEKLLKFQEDFGGNVARADKHLDAAIKDIDATINKLNATRGELVTIQRQFGLADKKLQSISVKKLTRGNPTMKAMIEEARTHKVEEPEEGVEGILPDSIE